MQPFPSGAYKTSQSVTGEPSLGLQMLQNKIFRSHTHPLSQSVTDRPHFDSHMLQIETFGRGCTFSSQSVIITGPNSPKMLQTETNPLSARTTDVSIPQPDQPAAEYPPASSSRPASPDS